MAQKTFEQYRQDFSSQVQAISALQYTSFGCQHGALKTLQQIMSNIVLPAHSAPSGNFEAVEQQITTAKRDFNTAAGDAEYTYTPKQDAWHEGFEKTLKPGAKNAMLGAVEHLVGMCLYYIQTMIRMKYTEERPAAVPSRNALDPHAHMCVEGGRECERVYK
jgi:hypothetical protein